MKRPPPQRARSALVALVGAALLAGCGSAGGATPGPAGEAPPGGAAALATSLVTSAGTWAVAVMGGSAATHNDFWQLFVRPAGSTDWGLVTPPGVADNGGLVIANAGGQSLITGFRPSQFLTFTPLSMTRDGGHAWSPTGPLGGALADAPDALAVAPASGQLLALLTSGAVQVASPGYTRWHTLTRRLALAATAAGRHCRLTSLTAVTFSTAGTPLLGGDCARPGVAGIFAAGSAGWRATGPTMPSAAAQEPVTVLRLTQTGSHTVALLKAGRGAAASLFAAWSTDGGSRWTLSSPLKLGAKLWAASFGPTVAIVLHGTSASVTSSSGGAWRPLPHAPAGTATVTPGSTGGFDALAVHRTKLTVWQLGPGTTAWHAVQVMNVPIQFGSSG